MKLILIILTVYPLFLFSQQNEIIICPDSIKYTTIDSTLIIKDKFKDKEIKVNGSIKTVIYNPVKPKYMKLDNNLLLHANNKGCVTSGMKYYLLIDVDRLKEKLPDGAFMEKEKIEDWLVNHPKIYSDDLTQILTVAWTDKNYKGDWQFMTHSQAVALADYLNKKGYGLLINIDEWNTIYNDLFSGGESFNSIKVKK